MSRIYGNWEKLVTATLRREEFREIALRTPSDLSSLSASSSSSPSFNYSSTYAQVSSLLVGDSFSYIQILRATNSLDDSNLVKRGHSGDLYFGVLENGTEVVVKKVDVSCLEKELCFVTETKIYGTTQHSRLIPLLGYCLDNANVKFLVYKHMPNKDLSRFLNGNIDGDPRVSSLDWTTRLKIATGVLEGLCYLHHECVPSLVHRDIQASSILLDDELMVQLGSLTDFCIEERESNKIKIPSLLRLLKGSRPSNPGTSNATRAYDVYCFGKVLLELITGKLCSPMSDSARKDWLECTLRQIDLDDKKLFVNIVDPSLIVNGDHLVQAWSVAFVAKICLDANPSERPQAKEVLLVLHSLGRPVQPTDHLSLPASTHGDKLTPDMLKRIGRMTPTVEPDDISGGSAASRLEFNNVRIRRLLEDYTRRKPQRYSYSDIEKITNCFSFQIGKGGFGTVFKGKLPNEEAFVAVKLLNSSGINTDIFINEVATMGTIHHENVVHLLGFCADGSRVALVYEFLPCGSLDKFIFQEEQDYQVLGVEKLQDIAIGIARGIEFLHQGCEQRILHLDIKPQNILLDHSYTPKISDFGLAKSYGKEISAVPSLSPRGTMGYIAPEMFSSQLGGVSSKSDVYSFGMLLLEMVGRRRNIDVYLEGTSELDYPERVYRHLMSRQELTLRIQVEEDGADRVWKKLAIVGLWCIQWKPENRPSITLVLQMLQGSIENLDFPPYDFPLTLFPHPRLSRNNVLNLVTPV